MKLTSAVTACLEGLQKIVNTGGSMAHDRKYLNLLGPSKPHLPVMFDNIASIWLPPILKKSTTTHCQSETVSCFKTQPLHSLLIDWLLDTQPNRSLFWTRTPHNHFRMLGILTKLSATTWQAIVKHTQKSRYNFNGAIKLNRDWSLANYTRAGLVFQHICNNPGPPKLQTTLHPQDSP